MGRTGRPAAIILSFTIAICLCCGCSGKLPAAEAAGHPTAPERGVTQEREEPEHMIPVSSEVQTSEPETVPKPETVSEPALEKKEILPEILALNAGDTAESTLLQAISREDLELCFYYEEISDEVFERMQGKSYKEDCTVPRSELRYVRFLHYGFDGKVHVGELVVNQAIASDIRDIFLELYEADYPVEKAILIDEYNADDEMSMRANNTSCFNFRVVAGSKSLSNHALGLAVDINPLYNPYVKEGGGDTIIQPETAKEYTDRKAECAYYISENDICYEAFVSRGFIWGGNWKSLKDYQHFERGK